MTALFKSFLEHEKAWRSGYWWLAIDVRLAGQGHASGIACFVQSLTEALCERVEASSFKEKLKILLVAPGRPAHWVVALQEHYPDIVFDWNGDCRFLSLFDKTPIWFWPTFVFRRLQSLTGNSAIWLAPANFDRPLFVSRGKMAFKVIQFVHDLVPFFSFVGTGFFFKIQFQFFVRRALRKLPLVATVSRHSADLFSTFSRSKSLGPVWVIPNAIEKTFGCNPKIPQGEALYKERVVFLQRFFRDHKEGQDFSALVCSRWILGVGRSEQYKCWDFAWRVVCQASALTGQSCWFLRVGCQAKEINFYRKHSVSFYQLGGLHVFPDLNIVIFPYITQIELTKIYCLVDLLIHPSLMEGFGFPPLEAALSGTPVLYRSGTAVDEHFPGDKGCCLPSEFWCSLATSDADAWAWQLQNMLMAQENSGFFQNLFKASSTRDFIVRQSGMRHNFDWQDSAERFLQQLIQYRSAWESK